MSPARLIRTPISIEFEEVGENENAFLREFDRYSEVDNDPVGQWINRAKGKGEAEESDKLTLTLIAELHKKVDELAKIIQNTHYKPIKLRFTEEIEASGFEHIKLINHVLQEGKSYYGRLSLPIFPQRDIPLFFEALDAQTVQITKMHGKDVTDWDGYLVSRERQEILDAKVKL